MTALERRETGNRATLRPVSIDFPKEEIRYNLNTLLITLSHPVMTVADCRADETGQYRCFREWIDHVAVSGSWLILPSEAGWFNGSLFAPSS